MRATGIDISKWQGAFEPQGNIGFVIQKVSEGLAKDALYDELLPAVKQIERRGAYHYFRTAVDPIEQAEFFWNTVKDEGFKWLVVDYEKTHNTLDARGEDNLALFVNYLETYPIPGAELVLYTSPYIFRDNLLAYNDFWADVPLWMAHYNGQDPETGAPNTWGNDWLFWQYSADGNGKGAEYGVGSADVDLNVFNGTVGDMDEWLGLTNNDSDITNPDCDFEKLLHDLDVDYSILKGRLEALEQKAHMHPQWMQRWFRK